MAICGLLAVLMACAPALAREVFDPSDASFAGSASLTFDSSAIDDAATTWQVTQDGVTFQFTSLSTQPVDGAAYAQEDTLLSFGYGDNDGLALTVNPPVSAIGFYGIEIDGCPGATFVGSTANEDVTAQAPCSPGERFFGAADIGDIGSIDIFRASSAFYISEVVFVPPGGASGEADVGVVVLVEDSDSVVVPDDEAVTLTVDVTNAGPDDASVTVADFLPADLYDGHAVTSGTDDYDATTEVLSVTDDLASAGGLALTIDGTTPTWPEFWCDIQLVNLAMAAPNATDPDLTNNLDVAVIRFDNAAQASATEICGDGRDNDCNGRADCADGCDCRPTLPPLPGAQPECVGGLEQALVEVGLPPTACTSEDNDAGNHACAVNRAGCGNVTVPPFCCDPASWSDPSLTLDLSDCDVGVPGCAPVDPNHKSSAPGVNLHGYGYTSPGQTITYELHYENIGNADAHDVLVIDVLDPDLDDETLVVHDGGVYDTDTRTLVWTDPVVPPDTPRSVSFEIDVRSDAGPGTRARNVATIVFPDAVPPTRIDTNFVEHVIPSPGLDLEPDLWVSGCTEDPPGEWTVDLVNDGAGFAYEVTAEILSTPDGVEVTDPEATFGHPDDAETGPSTVIPFATTTSLDTVAFSTEQAGDACASFEWRIRWEDLGGTVTSIDVGGEDDGEGCGCGSGSGCATGSGTAAPALLVVVFGLVARRRGVAPPG